MMLNSNFPTGADLPRLREKPRKARRGKVGRSYVKLGSAGFFPTPKTWGGGAVASDLRSHGVERIASPGKPPRMEYPAARSPNAGEKFPVRVDGASRLSETRTIGAGASVEAIASIAPTLADATIRYARDGVVSYSIRKYDGKAVRQRTHRIAR